MHDEAMRFLHRTRERFPAHFRRSRVLEVGSLNINGTARDLFIDPAEYVGLDLGPGPGVDVVCRGHEYDSAELFDVTISCEAFEHDRYWPRTFNRMVELTRPGGLIVVTCATHGRAEHGTADIEPESSPFTHDHYMNVGVREFVHSVTDNHIGEFGVELSYVTGDLYFWGLK